MNTNRPVSPPTGRARRERQPKPSHPTVPAGQTFPSADKIETAIVTACALFDEDPAAVPAGTTGLRSRHIALIALRLVYPKANWIGLGRCLGYWANTSAQGAMIAARKSKWWREIYVDEVVGALVADQYGEQAK